MKYSELEIGKWYFTDGDAAVKILDKLKDCFVVIAHSFRHQIFWVDTWCFDNIENENFYEAESPMSFCVDYRGDIIEVTEDQIGEKYFS